MMLAPCGQPVGEAGESGQNASGAASGPQALGQDFQGQLAMFEKSELESSEILWCNLFFVT